MREVALQMLWNFLYSQTYHLQLSLQFQVFVDDDVCIVRAFHILHHVVGYVCDYAQMAVCIVGMLDNHHLLAFEHQGFVAHINLRDVGIGWCTAVVYKSRVVDAGVGVRHGSICSAGSSSTHKTVGGVLSLCIDFHLVGLLSQFLFYLGNLSIQGIALGVVGKTVVDVRTFRGFLFSQFGKSGTQHRNLLLGEFSLYLHVVSLLYGRRQDVRVVLVHNIA